MKISIITVCFNSEKTLRDTIESVLSQDYQDIEYIVVDGASTDGTMNLINEYQDQIDRVVSEPDKGIYDAMNKGIMMSTGEVVGILNSDDFYENKNVISSIVSEFENNHKIDMVFGDVVFVRPDNLEKIVRYYSSKNFSAWKLRFGWMPSHPGAFVKKTAYEKYGLYNLKYKISADYEKFVRWLLVHRLQYKYIGKVLVRMRTGGVSTLGLKNTLLLNKEIVVACKSNGIYTNLLFVLSKIPFKLTELIRWPIRTGD